MCLHTREETHAPARTHICTYLCVHKHACTHPCTCTHVWCHPSKGENNLPGCWRCDWQDCRLHWQPSPTSRPEPARTLLAVCSLNPAQLLTLRGQLCDSQNLILFHFLLQPLGKERHRVASGCVSGRSPFQSQQLTHLTWRSRYH